MFEAQVWMEVGGRVAGLKLESSMTTQAGICRSILLAGMISYMSRQRLRLEEPYLPRRQTPRDEIPLMVLLGGQDTAATALIFAILTTPPFQNSWVVWRQDRQATAVRAISCSGETETPKKR